MSPEHIARAREIGVEFLGPLGGPISRRIAQALDAAYAAGEAAQRERDAKVADAEAREIERPDLFDDGWKAAAESIAAAIRGGGNERAP